MTTVPQRGADPADQQAPIVRASGSSMLPLIAPGDLVRFDSSRRSVRFGDVAVFRVGDRLVVHRVVSAGRRRQMGDNTSVATSFRNDDVVGLAVAVDGARGSVDLRARTQVIHGWAVAGRDVARLLRQRYVRRRRMQQRS